MSQEHAGPDENSRSDGRETDLSDLEKYAVPEVSEAVIRAQDKGVTDAGTADSDHDEAEDSPYLDGWRLYSISLSLFLALFLAALDGSIVATALVTIGREFNNFAQLQWIVLAYLLTELGFAFIFARISDIVGRKWASVAAVAILTISSLACGLSRNFTELVVFRAFQGIGGAGVFSLPFTVLPEITPPKKFAALSAFSGLTFVCSSILGPTLGGVITTHTTWRWVFFFSVPTGIFVIILMLLVWPNPQMPVAGQISWRQLDIVGCVLQFSALVLFIFALQEAGAKAYAWSSPVIITTLTLSATTGLALCSWLWYLSSGKRLCAPLFPVRIILDRVLGADLGVTICAGYVIFTSIVQIPQRFQLVNNLTPQQAGLKLLPLLASSAVASGIGGILSSTKNRTFPTLLTGGVLMTLGTALLSIVDKTPPNLVYLYEVILGLGFGLTIVSTIIVVKLNANAADAASAQGMQSQARLVGGNTGLALATIILNGHLDKDLLGVLTAQEISDVRSSLSAIKELDPAQVASLVQAFSRAFTTQMQVCATVGGVGVLLVLLMWQRHPPSVEDLMIPAEGE